MIASHRYEPGVKLACIDSDTSFIAHLGCNRTVAVHYLRREQQFDVQELRHAVPEPIMFDRSTNTINLFYEHDSKTCFSSLLL